MSHWIAAKKLNERGQCCGRKPIVYKRPPHLYCHRCDASFDMHGEQIENWAWGRMADGFDRIGPPYPKTK